MWKLHVYRQIFHVTMKFKNKSLKLHLNTFHVHFIQRSLCLIFPSGVLRDDLIQNTVNKKPMGHIAHLRKQFQSLNKYDYIITLIQRIKKKLYENLLVLHLNKLESSSLNDAFCQNWLKLAQWFWRRIFQNVINVYFHYFIIISSRKRAGPFI